MIRIILADDHHIIRQGLCHLLEDEEDFHVVAEAKDGIEAVKLVEAHKPDVLVVDQMMPGINGTEVIRQLAKVAPETRGIILSMHSSEVYVVEALNNGAYGYVLKEAESTDLMHAIREAFAGRRFLSYPLSEEAIAVYVEKAIAEMNYDKLEGLTSREREILYFVADDMSNTEISRRLSISSRTVESHRANMMHKLNLNSQIELIRYALDRGIIE